MAKQNKSGKGLTLVIGRALTDPVVRERIMKDPESVAKEHNLSDLDLKALKKITADELNDASKKLSVHTDWKIEVTVSGHFDTK